MPKIEMGKKVKDKITGFTGVVVSCTEFLTGCRRYGVQSQKLKKNGSPLDWFTFDEDQLELVEKKVKIGKGNKGGNPNYDPRK